MEMPRLLAAAWNADVGLWDEESMFDETAHCASGLGAMVPDTRPPLEELVSSMQDETPVRVSQQSWPRCFVSIEEIPKLRPT